MEIWKDIIGYEGLYQVSNLSRVKRLKKTWIDKRGRIRNKKEVILKAHQNNYGRHLVGLSKNGKVKAYLVYRLAAIAFIPNPENKKTINHINGDYKDNRIENLEWATYSENLRHAVANGLKRQNQYTNYLFS